VEGPTLAELLRSPGAHDHDPARLAHELLGALAHIHGAGIVHRDVKPSNVIIGGDGRSRLTDFGVAQHPDATRLTNTGNVVGTMRYLAPELLSGARASPRSDLYSCGVLLGEALGRHEDGALRDLIARLTDRDPNRRPAGAAQALAELDFERGGTRAEPVAVVTEPTAAPTGPRKPTSAPTGPTEPTAAPTGPTEPTSAPTGPRKPTSAPTG